MTVHLDYAAVGRILREDMRGPIDDAARAIAAAVDTRDVEPTEGVGAQSGELVIVDHYTTDRAAAEVVIAHPAGLAMQAKHGTLTRAAAAVGLEVRTRA